MARQRALVQVTSTSGIVTAAPLPAFSAQPLSAANKIAVTDFKINFAELDRMKRDYRAKKKEQDTVLLFSAQPQGLAHFLEQIFVMSLTKIFS